MRNPAPLASPPSGSAAKAPEFAVWTPAELGRFFELTAQHHHGAMFRLAGMTGLRRGELCGLRWVDVDLDVGRIAVRQTITIVDGRLVIGGVKTARSRRTIDVDPATMAVVRSHRAAQIEQRLLMGAGYTDRGLVFAMVDGRPWKPDTISQAFDRIVKRSGLPRIRFHDYADLRVMPTLRLKALSHKRFARVRSA